MPDELYTVQQSSDTLIVVEEDSGAEAEAYTVVEESEVIEVREVVVLTLEGAGSGNTVQLDANGPISGQRVITTDDDGLAVYASNDSADLSGPFMLSQNAAVDGDPVQALILGEETEPGWAWTPQAPVYLGVAGQLTQVPPTAPAASFILQVGVAVTATKLFFDPRPPILLI